MSELGVADVIYLTIFVFLSLAVVPVCNGTVVSGDTAVNLSLCSAVRSYCLLA